MNKQRRKEIEKLVSRIEELVGSFQMEMESIQSDLESILNDEQDYLDNIPENLQGSERYEVAEAAVDNLETAMSAIEDIISNVDTDELIDSLNSAME